MSRAVTPGRDTDETWVEVAEYRDLLEEIADDDTAPFQDEARRLLEELEARDL